MMVVSKTMKLQGIFPPIATPFDHNGEIYAAKVRHNVEKWNRTALSGYVVLGSTGRKRHADAGREDHGLGVGGAITPRRTSC